MTFKSDCFLEEEKAEETSNNRHKNCPVSLRQSARDAYLLFQVSILKDT